MLSFASGWLAQGVESRFVDGRAGSAGRQQQNGAMRYACCARGLVYGQPLTLNG